MQSFQRETLQMKTARGITKTPMLKSRSAMSLEPIFLFSFPRKPVEQQSWETAMLAEVQCSEWQPPESFTDETKRLAKRKYESDSHNQKR